MHINTAHLETLSSAFFQNGRQNVGSFPQRFQQLYNLEPETDEEQTTIMAALRDFVYGKYTSNDELALSPSWLSFSLQKALRRLRYGQCARTIFIQELRISEKRSNERGVTSNFCDTYQRTNKNRTKYFQAVKCLFHSY